MQIHTVARTSLIKQMSEDAYSANPAAGLFGVFDGVTPLVPYRDERGWNGAHIASRTFKEVFDHADAALPLREAVCEANRRLRERMVEQGIDLADKAGLWATCAAVVRFEEDRQALSFAHLGDCMLLAEREDGTVDVVTTDKVRGVSERARQKRERERTSGAELPDESWYEEEPRRQLLYNRTMANTPDGYSVANGTPEVEAYIHSGRLSLKGIRSVLLLTDGLFEPGQSMETTLRLIRQHGLEAYADWLEEGERKGEAPSDDKTGIWIELD